MVCGRKTRSPDTPWSWVVCAATCFTTFLHYGFSLSFGVFLPVLSEYFHENKEKTAWAGSIALSFSKFSGIFGVLLVNRFGHRAIVMGSGLLCSISLISSSFVNNLKILYFSYGVLYGLNAGIILNTCYTLNHVYFKKSSALPTGIMSTGSSLGVIVFGPSLEQLVEAFGWRTTFRIMGGLMVLICLVAIIYDPVTTEQGNALDSTDIEESRVNRMDHSISYEEVKKIDFSIKECMKLFTNCTFTAGLISSVLTFLGFYVPLIHLVQFAKDTRISSKAAAQLFIYIGICSSLSRIIIGKVLDKKWLTPLHCLQLMSFIVGLSIIFLTFAKEYKHFVIFAVVYGLANGAFVTNVAVFFLGVSGSERASISLAMGFMLSSITVCGGPPFIGFIADEFGSYIPSFYVAGGIVTFASIFPSVFLSCNQMNRAAYEDDPEYIEETPLIVAISPRVRMVYEIN